jgi:signal transduction histidine kinase/DNA-binding response OmpR family regulator
MYQPDGSSTEHILNFLRDCGFQIHPVITTNAEALKNALGAGAFDVVLVHGKLTELEAQETSALLKSGKCETPLLLLAVGSEDEAELECRRLGASDYILAGQWGRLPLAMKRMLAGKKIQEENARLRSELEQAGKRVRQLMENGIYGTFQAHVDGVFESANETLQHILACSNFAELQTLNLSKDVFRYPEAFVQILSECREHGMVRNAESEWRRRDGGFVSVRLHLRLFSGGEIEGFVEDVTEMRALERQLQQAQKFETIGQLAGGIAHDFNNVLGAVLGWAEIGYDQSREHPQLAEYFAHIRQQADRAATLTRELLTFARRETVQPRPVQINEVIKNLMSLLDKVIGKDIEIKVDLASLQPVKADPAQLEQVLMNICLNSRDAMPDGGRLRIKTEMILLDDSFCHFYPGVTAGSYVVLSISDTGTGMSPEVRERIFEPFFTTKERGKGSGMGLATVYGIVRQHGGFIHVYSEPGQGTLFHVYLPALENSLADSTRDAQTPQSAKRLQGVETILLAEDHDSIRELVRQSLSRLGYHILAAADGKQALHLAQLEPPALAVLDVVMPQMGGAATAAELLRRNPNLPILFTSGFTENANNAVANVPGSHYLQKPYSPTSLASQIREMLDARE